MSNIEDRDNLPDLAPLEGELEPSFNFKSNNGTYEQGYLDGLKHGVRAGANEALERVKEILPEIIRQEIMQLPEIKSALSEGLRCGSSKSGRALVEIYRYGKIEQRKKLH